MPDITIIDDGSGPDNFDRGDRAFKALKRGGYVPDDAAEVPQDWVAENYQIPDLICDLLHLARRSGGEVADTIARAVGHYGSDCVEQAWQNDEGWANCLQDAANMERAERVLEVCGVPEEYHQRVYRMVGLLPPTTDEGPAAA